jgi:hypothetical protein
MFGVGSLSASGCVAPSVWLIKKTTTAAATNYQQSPDSED